MDSNINYFVGAIDAKEDSGKRKEEQEIGEADDCIKVRERIVDISSINTIIN